MKYDIKTAKPGDKFVVIERKQYSYGIRSALTYVVVRAGSRDVVCNHLKPDGSVAVYSDNNQPVEYRFKCSDRLTAFYTVDSPEVGER